MAKFCTKCGKEIKDGKACDCEASVAATTTAAVATTGGVDISKHINKYIEIIKGIFTKPIETIKENTKSENFGFAIIALVVNCIVFALFAFALLDKMELPADELFEAVDGHLFNLIYIIGNVFENDVTAEMDVEFMDVFLQGFLFMASWVAVAGVSIFVMANTVLKDKIDIKKAFTLVGITSVFATVTTLVATVCLFISAPFTWFVLAIAALFFLVYLYQGISEVTELDKNKIALVFVPAVVAATAVMFYLIPNILY